MTSADARMRALIIQQAAEWYAVNRGDPTPDEGARFATWLTTSPVHVEEYLAVAAVDRDLREACADTEETLEAYLARRKTADHNVVWGRWPRNLISGAPRTWVGWRSVAAAAACILALCLSIPLWKYTKTPEVRTAQSIGTLLRFQTRHGEQLDEHLSDGSVVHLNTDSSLTVRYDGLKRLVTLSAGQADFEVAHEAKRPFTVFAGPAEVRAVGTNFDVRIDSGSAVVTVVEGQVGVRSSGARIDGPFTKVSANQQLRVIPGTVVASPTAVDAESETSWIHKQIAFDNEPLERVVAEFNRYMSTPIEIDSPSLRQLRVSGVFATDDTESFVRFLGSLPGVRVEVTPKAIRLFKK